MRSAGKISHISRRGRIIARSKKTPPLGAPVYTSQGEFIGKVQDIFGPTKKPYISIKPTHAINLKKFENRVGEALCVERIKWGAKKRIKKQRKKWKKK